MSDKLTALTKTTTLADTDLVYVVTDVAGTPTSKGIEKSDLKTAVNPILTAYKSADESKVNSTAYGIDADLILTMEANALYEFTAMLIATSDSSSSIRARFNNPVDAVGEYTEKYSSEGETQLYGSKLNIIGNSLKTIGQLKGIVSSVTGGTFQFAWGQNSSGAIGSTIHKGSTISLKKLN